VTGLARARAACVVLVLALLVGCQPHSSPPSAQAPPAQIPPPASAPPVAAPPPSGLPTGLAVDGLAVLPIKGRAPKTGYSRDRFGPTWADVDHNGCDTRNDMLARDLADEKIDKGCTVLSGVLVHDPYTGKKISFTRGQGTSDDVQIDHVVALSDAWQKGAQQLDDATRRQLANDPLDLLAVDGPTNQAKNDSDAATWLPPQRGYWCPYVARQISVKLVYRLWITQAEHDRMTQVLKDCPSEELPQS
jgi:hypothetical protein